MEEVGEKKKENLEGKKKKERPRGTQGENNVVFFMFFCIMADRRIFRIWVLCRVGSGFQNLVGSGSGLNIKI